MNKAFKNIMAGLEDALAYAEGDASKAAKVHTIEVADVKRIRESTGLSQAKFAATFQIPIGTLQGWEQGRRRPEGPAAALLRIIEADPTNAIKALHA